MSKAAIQRRGDAGAGGAKVVLTLGVALVLGATIAVLEAAPLANLSSGQSVSGDRQAGPQRSLIFKMPPAYGHWSRTDYVGVEAARAALADIVSLHGLASTPVPEGAPLDSAAAVYSGQGGKFVIHLERLPSSVQWAPPGGPTTIVAGHIFQDHAGARSGVLDLSLHMPGGLLVAIRGRGTVASVEPFIERLALWGPTAAK